MSTTKTQPTDDSTEPEISDVRLEALSDEILDTCDEYFCLDFHVNSLHIAQLDDPWCDDSREVRFMLDTSGGNSKAKMIDAIYDSDLPLKLESTCGDHRQISFHVTE